MTDSGALPTFFIVGAAKAGTTSLHWYLDQHPEIGMSRVKEPNYLSGPANGLPYPTRRISTLDEYQRLFDASFPMRGEASPSYTNFPRRAKVPQRIANLVPDARFIYLLRDPVERSISHFSHEVAIGSERRSLSEAMADLDDRFCYFLCQSRYATQLSLYLEHFPEDRILVVEQGDLRDHRRPTLRRIFSFLGVDPGFDGVAFDTELYRSAERRVYSRHYARFIDAAASRGVVRAIPSPIRHRARQAVERVLWRRAEPPAVSDDVRSMLCEALASEAEAVRTLTGKQFSSWSI
jgi:hypothetical protein